MLNLIFNEDVLISVIVEFIAFSSHKTLIFTLYNKIHEPHLKHFLIRNTVKIKKGIKVP